MVKPASKTQQALAMMEKNPEMTAYAAAKAVGIHTNTLYTAIARQRAKPGREVCPTCGKPL